MEMMRFRRRRLRPGEGIEVIHRTERSKMIVVEVPQRPYTEPILCPTCRVVHTVKSVHLWLDDRGACIVSEGVLDDLELAGLPNLRVGGVIKHPPMITVGHHVDRAEIDYRNRSQTIYRLDGFNTNCK